MKETMQIMKTLFAGKWSGEGFAKFPAIDGTGYAETSEYIPDECKDAIFFRQHTWYKNKTEKNGRTVFWDTGFIILQEDKIVLHCVQIGGRMESYALTESTGNSFVFDSTSIEHDLKAIRSQRVYTITSDRFHYEMNMATHAAEFQNHLQADLKKI